ncbi:hypothetical protein BDY24DRAFT_385989 [Mrakia frigida]|uniref:uncharacterized protein n=1 Tax=Mrakia frigida TaxID=29902 RepID=UPI003FCC1E0F
MSFPSPSSFSGRSNEELVLLLQRAESELIRQRRELSIDGGIFVKDGDLANLTEQSGKPWVWSSSTKEVSPKPIILPRLPNEILRAIAYECDNKTLTSLTRTSFVWLEIASPILYKTFTPRSHHDFENFVNPTHSLALSSLLPRLSLDKVIHLTVPVWQRSGRYQSSNSDSEESLSDDEEEDETDSDDEHSSTTPFPLLSFPNLQTLELNITASYNPSYPRRVVLAPVLDLLASLNPKNFTFSSTQLNPPWPLQQTFARRCLFAWTNLEVVTCRNTDIVFNVLDDEVHLLEMDPTPYSSTVYRFVWDVVENFADFSDGEGLERVLEDGVFGRAWNRSHGALEILVANELDKEEVEETLEDHLGKGWRDTVVVLVLKEEQKASRWTRLSNDERALKTALLDVY